MSLKTQFAEEMVKTVNLIRNLQLKFKIASIFLLEITFSFPKGNMGINSTEVGESEGTRKEKSSFKGFLPYTPIAFLYLKLFQKV